VYRYSRRVWQTNPRGQSNPKCPRAPPTGTASGSCDGPHWGSPASHWLPQCDGGGPQCAESPAPLGQIFVPVGQESVPVWQESAPLCQIFLPHPAFRRTRAPVDLREASTHTFAGRPSRPSAAPPPRRAAAPRPPAPHLRRLARSSPTANPSIVAALALPATSTSTTSNSRRCPCPAPRPTAATLTPPCSDRAPSRCAPACS
jgi:hypothetical protein